MALQIGTGLLIVLATSITRTISPRALRRGLALVLAASAAMLLLKLAI